LHQKLRFLFLLFVLPAISFDIYAQHVIISGTVSDEKTGEVLPSANIYNPDTHAGAVSNEYGFYSLKLPAGNAKIRVSYIGYATFEKEWNLTKDTVLHIRLTPELQLQEVIISGSNPRQSVETSEMSTVRLSAVTLGKIPLLLGEADLIKTLQMMPGVQGGNEGTSGFYVRGGGPDQNLILLDGVPVYNVNHLFGFMSVFNPDAIRNVTMIKGGFPARYGSRLSSVLDIRMKEGNNRKFSGDASIGVISSQLTLQGPVINDRTSFMVSGRRSYIDILSYPFQMMINRQDENRKTWVGYFLQDFNAKINHTINDRNKLYLSFYTGKDKLSTKFKYKEPDSYGSGVARSQRDDRTGLQWGNVTAALRWNRIISNRLFFNFTATVSAYKFKFSASENYESNDDRNNYDFYMEYFSRIRDYGVAADFDFIPDTRNSIKFGGSFTRHGFSPGVTVFREADSGVSADTVFGNIKIPAYEFQAYAEDDITITRRLKINFGLHVSLFSVQGTAYTGLEPRLSGRFLMTPNLSLKVSYAFMQQYLHLLANSSMGLPTDLWVPATGRVKPQKAQQAAVGLAYSFHNAYEFTVEGYYKKMNNLIDYSEGAGFLDLNRGDWEDLVTTGRGDACGVEVLIRKPAGKLTGWIGYTLSWANRYFAEISQGRKYPFKYDARNDISITANYTFNKRIDAGVVWVYRTGYPFTLEDSEYISLIAEPHSTYSRSDITGHFAHRNNYRMPDYHRLDICVNFHKEKLKVTRTWSLGMYNAYGRNNPFMVYPHNSYEGRSNKLVQISILNYIPYIKWSLKF
jgi:outer membrane cobalamin receptor